MNIEILSIGNEVVSGNIVNTNAAWLSDQLWLQGFEVVRHITIADDENQISKSLLDLQPKTKVVIITGGLGPTVDDFTIEIAAKIFKLPLKLDHSVLKKLQKKFKSFGREMSSNQEKQALIPKSGKVLQNVFGTAPGVQIKYRGVEYFFLPGVPKEMKQIFQDEILPWLKKNRHPKIFFKGKILRCFGAAEAKLDLLLRPLLKDRVSLGNSKIAFRISFPEIFIKISSSGNSLAKAEKELAKATKPILKIISPYLYGEDEETMEQVVGKLLIKKKKSLTTAESCTGGLIANRITNISGASNYFMGGIVCYSNELKIKLLGVSEKTLKKQGAVSEKTAIEMASGARKRFNSDIAIAVTGIAGPTGGTKEKPVGTIYIALADEGGCEVKKFFFPYNREWFKMIVSSIALNWIRKRLLEK